jgi:hypothetical protein
MWFPQSLFMAINGRGGYGRMVMLAGPSQVGKTIIATMAMNPHTYTGSKLSQYEPQCFISLHAPGSAGSPLESFLGALHTIDQLRHKQPSSGFVRPTGREEAHVKAVFLSSHESSLKTLKRDVLGLIWGADPAAGDSGVHPTIAFFDFAGERFNYAEARTLARWADPMDVIAVVLEAPDLNRFGRAANTPDTIVDPDSVARAARRLNMAADKRRCLIVTKLDLIPADKLDGGSQYLAEQAGIEDAKVDNRAKKIFCSWLNRSVPSEEKLANILAADAGLPVFFITTHNLDGHVLGVDGKMPVSVGLRQFLLWMLEWSR